MRPALLGQRVRLVPLVVLGQRESLVRLVPLVVLGQRESLERLVLLGRLVPRQRPELASKSRSGRCT